MTDYNYNFSSIPGRGRRLLAGLAPVLALGSFALVAGCGKKSEPAPAANPAGKVTTVGMTVVSTADVKSGDITKNIDVTGSLVALQDVVVGPKLAGKISAVILHEGDPVTIGQLIATMDTVDSQANLASAQANLAAALTREQQARVSVQQARNTLTNAQTTLSLTDKTTSAALSTAKSALESARENKAIVDKGARDQERAQAAEQVKSAKANFDKAKSDLRRYQELYRQQAVSQSQLDATQAAFDGAQSALNSAQLQVSLLAEGARPEEKRRAEIGVLQANDTLLKATADREQIKLRAEDVKNARTGIDFAIAGVASAKAQTDQARAAVRIAQDTFANTSIVSPISGYVAERKAEPGSQLGAGSPVMRIVNPSTIYFQATLSESQFADVKLGMAAKVTVDAVPSKSFAGRVTRILPVASSTARSFTVRIDFNQDSRLRPQMFARGSLLIDTHKSATLIPKDAVLFDAETGKNRVFTVGPGGKAQERVVKIGYSNPQTVEILGDTVKVGEKVIVAGQTALQSGDPIKVQ